VTSISKKNAPQKKDAGVQAKKNTKRKRGNAADNDAPRAFKRLMAYAGGKKTRSGLDDGTKPVSKKSTAAKTITAPANAEETPTLTIRPGERLSEFSRRVDAALPLAGLANKVVKDGKDPLGLKVWRTKKEMKMHKLYDEWREEDQKIKERKEEELEEAEERAMEENEGLGVSWKFDFEQQGGKKKKGKRSRYLGEASGKEENPWEVIKRNRGETKPGLHDVINAVPDLKLPRKKLLVDGAAVDVDDIPKAAGSLRQREELKGVRDEIVASYRKMMNARRPGQASS
jgi:hypothetical protein